MWLYKQEELRHRIAAFRDEHPWPAQHVFRQACLKVNLARSNQSPAHGHSRFRSRRRSTSLPCAAFGEFTNLLDFCREVDLRVVSRQDVLLLIKLGAFACTGLGRAQLAAAEQQYTSLAAAVRIPKVMRHAC